jgi:hypothetical protein
MIFHIDKACRFTMIFDISPIRRPAGGRHEMALPEGSNMKAPRGVNIPLGLFSSTFQKLPFLCEK